MPTGYSLLSQEEEELNETPKIKPRGDTKLYACMICGFLSLLCFFLVPVEKELDVWCVLFWLIPFYMTMVVFHRLFVFLEEICHTKERYAGKLSAFKACFRDLFKEFIGIIILQLIVCMFLPVYDYLAYAPVLSLSVVLVSYQIIRGESKVVIKHVLKDKPCMATIWAEAMFSSYLKVVLEDIDKRIEKYEEEKNVLIPLKKLLLIIPLNCDVRGTFEDHHADIKYEGYLEPKVEDQGANMNRRYKNPVYKIISPLRKTYYAVMEEPPPLFVLWNIKDIIAEDMWEYQRDIFISFLERKLQNLPCYIIIYEGKEPLAAFLSKKIEDLVSQEKCSVNIGDFKEE